MTTTINHINLGVTNAAKVALFFERVLAFRRSEVRGEGRLIILESSEGFVLTLMKDKTVGANAYPTTFHLGALQPDPESVVDLARISDEAGFGKCAPSVMRGNTFGFYVQLPDGIRVEISALLSKSQVSQLAGSNEDPASGQRHDRGVNHDVLK